MYLLPTTSTVLLFWVQSHISYSIQSSKYIQNYMNSYNTKIILPVLSELYGPSLSYHLNSEESFSHGPKVEKNHVQNLIFSSSDLSYLATW